MPSTMRFFGLVIAFAMMSLSLAAPVPVPEPQPGEAAPDSYCPGFVCPAWKRAE